MSKATTPPVIRLRGVRHNNLKNFDLDLPLRRLIVVTGLSGSGKSSLAFDTLFAEGQRRYIETFSPYARQFFDRMDKPRVDSIEGIPPAIAIEQRNAVRTTRSTVGTMTEVCDYMKALWPQLAQLHCRQCGQPVRKDAPRQIWEAVNPKSGIQNIECLVTFDLPLTEKLPLAECVALISKQGYQRLLLDGEIIRLDEIQHLKLKTQNFLTVVQDRLKVAAANRARFVEACEQAYHFGKGRLAVHFLGEGNSRLKIQNAIFFSNRLHCAACDIEYAEPSPALFSFNHPLGACPACRGFGRIITIDYQLAVPDRSKTLREGVVKPWRTGHGLESHEDLLKSCKRRGVPLDVPFQDLPEEQQQWVIDGDPGYNSNDPEHSWPKAWYGVKGYFRWLESKAYKMHVRVLLSRYRAYTKCPECQGRRLKPEALLYRVRNETGAAHPELSLADFYALPVSRALELIEVLAASHSAPSTPHSALSHALSEVRARLGYLVEVGLGYLTLDRATRTLSGGETERVNLTTCLGTRLVNTLFVLDEPSVGLHPRDTARLVSLLQHLRDAGNTVLVVEHEAAVMRAANQIVDLGPGHGESGGEVVFQGSYAEILRNETSLTGQYLSGRRQIDLPPRRPVKNSGEGKFLKITGASRHNLKHLSVEIPLNRLVCVTGVSGSGKTTLIRECLLPALEARLKFASAGGQKSADGEAEREEEPDATAANAPVSDSAKLAGWEQLAAVVLVDQSPLGKTPRSNPAVYIGAFDDIRELFAQTEPARRRGLNASAFSFNSAQGQCERCRGAGFEKIEMQFLSDVFIRCPDCDGRRYRAHILEVKLSAAGREWSIADVLDATVDESVELLAQFPDARAATRASARLKILQEVGLGYLRLGQPINTLSGGESQRLKLVAHLADSAAVPAEPGGRRITAKTTLEEIQQWARERAAVHDGKPVLEDQSPATPASTLFLFDEPTTGLHFDDVRVLLKVFQRLVEAGHSVLIIEHNLEVIKCADWLIDLGPEAGEQGGELVAQGTPEDVAACAMSHTGRFLRELVATKAERLVVNPESGIQNSESAQCLTAADAANGISIHGAREHNLKNLSVEIPRGKFVVVTGVSGSGKSTLAFDLLFAEGQRRFLDSMNAYARQFVEQMARPDVDFIAGLPPTVSIEQRNSRGGGKSTVATVTEIFHFLRLLFARLGTQYCPQCQVPVEAQTRDKLGRRLQNELKRRGDLLLLAPVVRKRKGFHSDVAAWAAKHGYKEIRADGKIHATSQPFRLDRFKEHDVEIVTGVLEKRRSTSRKQERSPQQLVDETLKLGQGALFALDNHGALTIHSTECSCPQCGTSFAPLDPKNFSYNSPQGWCPRCRGFGELFYLPEDVDRGARADAIEESWFEWQEGKREPCPECHGSRLNPVARAVRLRQLLKQPTMAEFSALSVAGADDIFRQLNFKDREAAIARDILPEIRERLKFLNEVGLGYLQLGRGVPTLSGGEAQRIRLAAQLGSNLSGVLYVLDEPTIGLHARDNEQLLAALHQLQARGNSLVVVEHDEETMRRADYIIDLGPGAGVRGGQVVAAGTLKELLKHGDSITGQCLRAQEQKNYPARGARRPVSRRGVGALALHRAAVHNLKKLTVRFPLNRFVVVTGVSGSGKSTLVRECLLPAVVEALKRNLKLKTQNLNRLHQVTGCESLKAVYEVDQSPIGRTPRSTPATYVGFFDDIRALFAQVPEARLRGYGPGRFSFNSAQGRCPECEGAGEVKLEMNFLPPAYVRCEACGGLRFNRETLDLEFNGRNIAQVLDLSVAEAIDFFAAFPRIRRPLEALRDTGLDYLKLGQTSPTLSGGEAQRVKLVTHLLSGLKPGPEQDRIRNSKAAFRDRQNLFILEEPTIGLHMADVRRLVEVLQRLVDAGHSVIVIEHNLDFIAEADWVIDLGPEGGAAGGRLVAQGPPEEIAKSKGSHTGRFLRSVLRG